VLCHTNSTTSAFTVKPRLHDTTCCETGCQAGLTNRLYRVYKHSTGCQTGLTTDLTTGWMFVYTIQPIVKPDVQQVWQPVVSCKRGLTETVCDSFNRTFTTPNRFLRSS